MRKSTQFQLAQSILLLLVGFMAGQLLATRELTADYAADATSPLAVVTRSNPVVPERDVPGVDIAGLPRYPGARRVEYRLTIEDNLVVTEADYFVTAELEAVHNYYRGLFHTGGWSVADLDFQQGEWSFLVVIGSREALVELEAWGELVEIELEVSEPQNSPVFTPDRR